LPVECADKVNKKEMDIQKDANGTNKRSRRV
jgi:hypothetical protein